MADFNQALQMVLQNEGGYVNDPNDPGGETYKGIARKMNSNWIGWQLIDLQKKQNNIFLNACVQIEFTALGRYCSFLFVWREVVCVAGFVFRKKGKKNNLAIWPG